jgi:hypothetical protein
MANVTITTTETVYLYTERNLLIAYTLAVACTTVTVLMGTFAFYRNGVAHDAVISTFAVTLRNPEVGFPSMLSKYTVYS